MKLTPYLVAPLIVLLAACSSKGGSPKAELPIDQNDPLAQRRIEAREAKLSAYDFFLRARTALDSSDFASAIENYDKLTTRHPFSEYAVQGELDRIYALYRNFEPDRALSAADRFVREHPRHAAIDYVQYLKGLINFHRDTEGLSILPVDESKSDVSSHRRAYDDFATLLQKFPRSRYASDAHQRMIFLRNRLADHELHVVDFYVRRGAYVAAAKRAEQVVGQYPGTRASHKALALLEECYVLAGLPAQAEDVRRLLAVQPALPDAPVKPAAGPHAAITAPPVAVEKPGFGSRIAGLFSSEDKPSAAPLAADTESPAKAMPAQTASETPAESPSVSAPVAAAPAAESAPP